MAENPLKPCYLCRDCGGLNDSYMVRREVWFQAVGLRTPETPKPFFLCFRCLEKRLGRPLQEDDFDLKLVINLPIALGIRMGKAKREDPI